MRRVPSDLHGGSAGKLQLIDSQGPLIALAAALLRECPVFGSRSPFRWWLVAGLVITGLASVGVAQETSVTLDGTLPSHQGASLPRGDDGSYRVGSELGVELGAGDRRQLFHSFGRFDLATGESAIFGGTSRVQAILVRVTGGRASQIDGRIEIDRALGNPHLFLMNPWGISFGRDATLDVHGAFTATTADRLTLGGDGTFEARFPARSVLSASAVSAFGFDTRSPAPIDVLGQLDLEKGGHAFALVGGDLVLDGGPSGFVSTRGGDAALVSVASPGEVELLGSDGTPFDVSGFSALGRIALLNDAILSTSKIPPTSDVDLYELGHLLWPPTVRIDPETDVVAGSLPDLRGSGDTIDVYFRRDLGPGSGNVFVRGQDLRIVDSDIRTFTASNDPGGRIDVALRGVLEIRKRGRLEGVGLFAGAESFERSGPERLLSSWNDGTHIFYGSITPTVTFSGTGRGGDITVRANDVRLTGGAVISSTSQTAGEAGNIDVVARDSILLHGRAQNEERTPTAFFSNAQGSGAAGSIRVETDTLRLEKGGAIIAQTTGDAPGGNIDVRVGSLAIRGTSQIDASTSAQSLPDDSTDTTSGVGGSITVRARDRITISGREDERNFARISTFSQERSTGPAGDIHVSAPVIEISNGGGISVRSRGAGLAGSITIDAHDRLIVRSGSIEAAAPNSDGGDITLRARDRIVLEDSEVTASVGGGAGGNIDIDPRFVVLNHSRIVAQAGTGTGGSIDIEADQYLRSVGSAVDASSRAGIDGTVVISTPDSDVASDLAALPEAYLDASDLLAEHCAARRGTKPGSFVLRGRGGTPDTPARARPPHYRIEPSGVDAGAEPGAERRGDRASAIAYWNGVVTTSTDPAPTASAWLELAQLHDADGNLEAAGAALVAAQSAAEKLDDATARAAIAGVRARLRGRAGDTKLALAELDEALVSATLETAAALQLDAANLLSASGARDQAEDHYAESERLGRESGALLTAALAAVDRARSRAEAERSVAALDALPVSSRTIDALLHVAHRLPPDEHPRAAELYASAAARAEELGDARAASYAWGWLGAQYELEGRLDESLELTRRAVSAAQQADAPESLYLWQWQIGRLNLAQGNLPGSLRAYQAANETLAGLRVAFALRDASERSVAREYPVEPVVRGLVDVLLRVAATTEDPAEHDALLAQARRRLEDLNATELQDYFADACVATQRRVAPETVAGTVVVYPVILADRIELIASLPGQTRTYVVPIGSEQLSAEVRLFREQVQDRTTNKYRPQAEKLYRWLVAPLEPDLARLGQPTLIWVSTGSLRGLPFAALRDEQTGQFLIEKYPLAVAPGLTLTDPQPIDRQHSLALKAGLAEAVQGFGPLASVPGELVAVGEVFPGPTLLNRDFVAKRLEDTLASEPFGIVHIASHAEFGSDINDAYILTYDGKLGMNRLSELVGLTEFRDQPLELLTLSACRTAAGDERSALGLAGVAVKAGARSTLASLWYVEDVAASRLVADFYRELAQPGVSRAAALQTAQKKLLADPSFKHPVSWAPFILIGSWL